MDKDKIIEAKLKAHHEITHKAPAKWDLWRTVFPCGVLNKKSEGHRWEWLWKRVTCKGCLKTRGERRKPA